jgi:hypothetical protein
MADDDAPLGQDQLDIAQAQAEHVIEILCGWKAADLLARFMREG